MTIRTIERQNVVDEVYEQIKTNIANQVWKPGDKLPSEAQLCKMFNVSRVSIRSAIQKLRVLGIITTRHGQGSFVSAAVNSGMVEQVIPIMNLGEKEFMDMMEFREAIEFKCIDLAVERADEADLGRIKKALNNMIANRNDYKKYSVADFEFHLEVAKASKNDVLYKIMKNTASYYYYLEELNRVFGVDEASLKGHQDQYRHLCDRDADGVKARIKEGMDQNIVKIRNRIRNNSQNKQENR